MDQSWFAITFEQMPIVNSSELASAEVDDLTLLRRKDIGDRALSNITCGKIVKLSETRTDHVAKLLRILFHSLVSWLNGNNSVS